MPFAKTETAFVEHFSEHWPTMGNGSRAVRRLNIGATHGIGAPLAAHDIPKR
jgi:hypothetical protein